MSDLERAREIFAKDIYATETTGIIIDAAAESYAKCSLKIEPKHLNAVGGVMGGAIFTLADFTFAVASNTPNLGVVSLTSQISYLGGLKGDTLIAEAKCEKFGKNVCFFVITVVDNLGNPIANVSATGYRK